MLFNDSTQRAHPEFCFSHYGGKGRPRIAIWLPTPSIYFCRKWQVSAREDLKCQVISSNFTFFLSFTHTQMTQVVAACSFIHLFTHVMSLWFPRGLSCRWSLHLHLKSMKSASRRWVTSLPLCRGTQCTSCSWERGGEEQEITQVFYYLRWLVPNSS